MEGTPSRRRLRRFAFVAVPILALLLAVSDFHATVDLLWEAMRRRTRELLAEARARDPSRPVLRGKPLPGNAWDDYRLALAAAKTPRAQLLWKLLDDPKSEPDPQVVRAIVGEHRAALEHLQRGVLRTMARIPWEIWPGPEASPSERTQRVFDATSYAYLLEVLADCQSVLLDKEGRHRQALELMLELYLFGEDIARHSTVWTYFRGLDAMRTARSRMERQLSSGDLNPELLAQLDRELEIIDRNFPRWDWACLSARAEVGLHVGNQGMVRDYAESFLLLNGKGPKNRIGQALEKLGSDPRSLRRLRYGFSERLFAADALDLVDRWMVRVASCERQTWTEAQAVLRETERDVEASDNFLAERSVDLVVSHARYARTERAKLRLLRIGARFRATGEVIDLADPFGERVLHSRAGDGLRAWSVGEDGTDNGGDAAKDIVLELPVRSR